MDDEKYTKKVNALAQKMGWDLETLGDYALDFIEMDTDPQVRAKFFHVLKTRAKYERQLTYIVRP